MADGQKPSNNQHKNSGQKAASAQQIDTGGFELDDRHGNIDIDQSEGPKAYNHQFKKAGKKVDANV